MSRIKFEKVHVIPGQSYSVRECLTRVAKGLGLPSYMVKNGGVFNGANNLSPKAFPDDLTALEFQRRKVESLRRKALQESNDVREARKQSDSSTNTPPDSAAGDNVQQKQ